MVYGFIIITESYEKMVVMKLNGNLDFDIGSGKVADQSGEL